MNEEFSFLINCFDLLNSLYETSSNDCGLLQSPICQSLEDLDISLIDEIEDEEFVTAKINKCLSEMDNMICRNNPEDLTRKRDINKNYKNIKGCDNLSKQITCGSCPDNYDYNTLKKYPLINLQLQDQFFSLFQDNYNTSLEVECANNPDKKLLSCHCSILIKSLATGKEFYSNHRRTSAKRLIPKSPKMMNASCEERDNDKYCLPEKFKYLAKLIVNAS